MPSNRKRIGFLPSEEVHNIIEKICKDNKFSQSKVTGILVEEALRSRGALKNIKYSRSFRIIDEYTNPDNLSKESPLNPNNQYSYINNKNMKEDLKMINEFIEFKFFKKIMNQNNIIVD